MDYQKIYDSLIERARTRILDCYVEKHHIVPKCMGGSNRIGNLVELTPEEHYVAHQLLVKIYPNNHKLIYSAAMMTQSSKYNVRRGNRVLYGWLKRKMSKANVERNKKIHTGTKRTKESKALMSRKAKESYENGRELSPSCFKKVKLHGIKE